MGAQADDAPRILKLLADADFDALAKAFPITERQRNIED